MLTTAQPIVEIAKDTYEIDEFDCGSIFVLVGKDKAMVIDTGTGIGDLPSCSRTPTATTPAAWAGSTNTT